MPERPTSVSICGILFLIFGVMGLFGSFSSMGTVLLSFAPGGKDTNPVVIAMKESPAYALYMQVMILPILGSAVLSIVAGLKLLKGRAWARKAGMILALWNVVAGILSAWTNVTYVAPHAGKMMATLPATPGVDPKMMEELISRGMLAGAIGTVLFSAACAVVVIYFLCRKDAIEFCQGFRRKAVAVESPAP